MNYNSSELTLRTSVLPENVESRTPEIIEYCLATGMSRVMLITPPHELEQYLIPIKRMSGYVESADYAIRRFREAGLGAEINFTTTMGHVDVGHDISHEFDFQFMVGLNGHISKSIPCPFDPAFQEYIVSYNRNPRQLV